ncbi:MAG TPA: hypothetical protein VGR89_06525, partial [Puia sp.]|nr:hypothetical protein [Puia sp.]
MRKRPAFAAFIAAGLLAGTAACSAAGAAVTHHPKGHDPAYGINVTSSPYSAACDGSTDDTSAIQSALTAAGNAGGGIVQIPATGHNCKITSTLTVPTNVILQGPGGLGGEASIWFDSTGNGPAIQVGPTSGSSPTDEHGGGLQDLGIIGNSSSGGYPNQIGVQVSGTVDVNLSNVDVTDTGIAYQVNGNGAGDWNGELDMFDPMASNVVTGFKFTNSGGTETDTHIFGGYMSGVSDTTGYGLYATGLHSSVLEGVSVESFADGVYLTTGTQNNQFFGGRAENSGSKNGTTSFVCSGSGV